MSLASADAQRDKSDAENGARPSAERGRDTPAGARAAANPADRGAELYASICAHCHDRVPEGTALAMLPGPASLTLKYGGRVSPYIKERPDLANAATLGAFLRNGTGSMPPFRKTEITDADVAAIAAYFARTSSN